MGRAHKARWNWGERGGANKGALLGGGKHFLLAAQETIGGFSPPWWGGEQEAPKKGGGPTPVGKRFSEGSTPQ